MGVGSSTANKLDKALASDLPEEERYFGLENFGNTCYCNSVLQALYFCEPFRRHVISYDRERKERSRNTADRRGGYGDSVGSPSAAGTNNGNNTGGKSTGGGFRNAIRGVGSVMYLGENSHASDGGAAQTANGVGGDGDTGADCSERATGGAIDQSGASGNEEETLLTALGELFTSISGQKKRTGSVPPKAFINRLRQENELFSSYMHQDAHEFLNYVLNEVVECVTREHLERRRRRKGLPPQPLNGVRSFSNSNLVAMKHEKEAAQEEEPLPRTFVHELFEGQLSNETKCLCCERVTQRVESFLDLSVDIAQNSSLTSCLRNFSSTELLHKQDKFFCDSCCSLQEAEKRMRIKRPPCILALHLKRFKFIEQIQKYKKLSYRVVFPLEYRLTNISDDANDADRLYNLFAVVVHVGSGPNHGHYVSLIKSHGQWLLFDDDCVEPKDESEIQSVFGCTQDLSTNTEAGYILFYESANGGENNGGNALERDRSPAATTGGVSASTAQYSKIAAPYGTTVNATPYSVQS